MTTSPSTLKIWTARPVSRLCVAGMSPLGDESVSSWDLDVAGRLEHAVLAVHLADAGLVVGVERVDEPRAYLSRICHGASFGAGPYVTPTVLVSWPQSIDAPS